ncbi:MAG: cache domain-containing protein [Phycisphaerae bacterium]|nr:cache domain-containing protein [Phycisphaerae bacterium]
MIIITVSLLISLLGYYVIKKDIIDRAQAKVKNDLNFAREVYNQQTSNIENAVRLTALRFFIRDAIVAGDKEILARELENIRRLEALDTLTLADGNGTVVLRTRNNSVLGDNQRNNEYVSRVLATGKAVGGTAIITKEELEKEGDELVRQARMKLIHTLKAKPSADKEQTSAIMIKAAAPVLGQDGRVIGILYGGNILNRNYSIVDKVKNIVYRGQTYKGEDVGTVTIFEGDVRISTNVTDSNGNRAIGTRVSEDVYNQVLVNGKPWVDRAFVVNAWYKSAYEPIRNIDGDIIGMLYVGTLEQPFKDIARNTMLMFAIIIGGATALAVLTSFFLADCITKPLRSLILATGKLSNGELGHTTETQTGIKELDKLAIAFNDMSRQLKERDQSLILSNELLADLNKRYIDLIGFVSHELKGIVGTIIMNVYSVRDNILGQINEKQKKSLDGAARNLDYLTATVKKFLNLGKIEKGELEAKKAIIAIKEDVFDVIINSLSTDTARKNLRVDNQINANLKVDADVELLQIAANNLLGNAIKYGRQGGDILITSRTIDNHTEIEVYNDSAPIKEDQKDKLFKRFSRLDNPETRSVKGSGLGLFITKQIIEKHGGQIRVEPKEKGNSFIFLLPIKQICSSKENIYV